MNILLNGEVDPRITNDPRWSDSQKDAVAKVAGVDANARVIGLDARMRPVVTAQLRPKPQPRSQYAVLRNGAPAKPVKPFAEVWNNLPPRRRTPTRKRSTR